MPPGRSSDDQVSDISKNNMKWIEMYGVERVRSFVLVLRLSELELWEPITVLRERVNF